LERIIKLVFWTNRAVKDLEKVTRFNSKLFVFNKAIEIQEGTEILESSDFNKISSIDEDFTHLKFEYRKLIHHHCKITYREGKNKIYINRIFDTRQNPNNNK
jgi:plasmid stabilization system protein ParE